MKIRVHAVHMSNDRSGSPRVLADALDALLRQGYVCRLITNFGEGFLPSSVIKTSFIPYTRRFGRCVTLFSYVFSQILIGFYLLLHTTIDRVKGNKPVVLVNTVLPIGACVIAKIARVLCVVYIHEAPVKYSIFHSVLLGIIDRCADEVLCVSTYLRTRLQLNRCTSSIVYNGLRSDFSFDKRVISKTRFTSRIVFFCGSPKPYKGIDTFIQLSKMMPTFQFVAALNCAENELLQLEQGGENLTLLSRPTNLNELYVNSFAFLNLSDPKAFIETFGLSVLEGMAAGNPVIAPPAGGILELAKGSGVRLLEPDNLDAIAFHLKRLSEDYSYWLHCSIAAMERAEKFSSEIYSDRFIQCIDRVVQNNSN